MSAANLPPGYRRVHLDDVASTNAEGLRLAALGEASGLWITARSQSHGRGRGGRAWSSPPGNLYASLLLRLSCPLAVVQQLTLLAPVALYDTVATLMSWPSGRSQKLRLKWPNDVLVDGAKVSGILLESAIVSGAAGSGAASPQITVVMGFGLNLASHPAAIDQKATHLHAHGAATTPGQALSTLAHATKRWLETWNAGRGFDQIRNAWLDRAGPIGEPLSVRVASDPSAPRISGHFAGLDATGALLLDHSDGSTMRFLQGDVALGAEDR